ncbi:hypothetical protein [Leifsonia sp. SIMBA_070]|uniref:hypothetical protein n=1 Tax=Leifsonia sp. SIMBA_070 TaxID=3085810 RepID=UPI00397D7387
MEAEQQLVRGRVFGARAGRPGRLRPRGESRSGGLVQIFAIDLIEKTWLYTELLDSHQVAWERVESSDPGRIVHEDDVQVIAVPWSNPD